MEYDCYKFRLDGKIQKYFIYLSSDLQCVKLLTSGGSLCGDWCGGAGVEMGVGVCVGFRVVICGVQPLQFRLDVNDTVLLYLSSYMY